MKKITVILFGILLICGLTACGNLKETPTKTLENDVKIITEEIVLYEDFESDFVRDSQYKYVSSYLSKRQTNLEDKQDIVFYDIIIQNDYFEIVYSYKLVYNYYDEGGWILDNKILDEKTVTPIKPAEAEQVVDLWYEKEIYINKTNYMRDNIKDFSGSLSKSNCDITNGKIELDSNTLQTKIYLDISNSLSNIKGYIPLEFDSQNGWYIPNLNNPDEDNTVYPCLLVSELTCDYSKAEGEFACGEYSLSLTINEQQGTVDYVYAINNSVIQNNQTSFDPISGQFLAFEYYDNKNDIWIGRSSNYYRK